MRLDEEATMAAWWSHRRDVVDPTVERHEGRIVKLTGDGFLAEFPSANSAVSAAVAIQREVNARQAATSGERRVLFRIGVNLGDILVDEEDIYGDDVNIAARIEALAKPGGLTVSASVHDQVRLRMPLEFEDLGEQELKNIDSPVHVYALVQTSRSEVDTGESKSVRRPSIAVLPFDNLSGDLEQGHFCDGMVEDIITSLSRLRHLSVISRNSSFSYRGRSLEIQRVAEELGAKYVLEGSVRSRGKRIRVTAQLIDGRSGDHVWAERYDRDAGDLFELQDDLTTSLVAAIDLELGRVEQAEAFRRPPESLDAWSRYQRGLSMAQEGSDASLEAAAAEFEAAIGLDPSFAQAHAALAQVSMTLFLRLPDLDAVRAAEDALKIAQTAVRLDPRDAQALCALGRAHVNLGQSVPGINALEGAVTQDPSSATAHHRLGFALVHAGHPEQGLLHIQKALSLSPRDPQRWSFFNGICCAHLMCGHYDQAAEAAKQSTAELGASWWVWAHLAAAEAHLGRLDEARAALTQAHKIFPEMSADEYATHASQIAHPRLIEQVVAGLERIAMAS